MVQKIARQEIILVTGGSRGIGAATAILAAQRGYAVCINYVHNREAAETVADAIRKAGGSALTVAADVAVEEDVVRLFKTIDEKLGRLTALVNNAGVLEKKMMAEQMDAARINRVLMTNVTGSLLCAREAILRMSNKHGGSGGGIVNLSSMAAKLGGAGEYVDYAASKGAIDAMTIGLAKELADQDIRVNAVRPGLIYTEIHASGGEAGRVDRLSDTVPMKRGGTAQEVAEAIMWLLSDQASYSTGAFIDVAGGR